MEKSPQFEVKTELSPERRSEIVKRFKGMGFSLEDNGQHFIARGEADGKEVARHFPLWETMDLEGGGSVKTIDDIEAFFRFGPKLSTRELVEKLREYRNKRQEKTADR
ncbi:MAG: hypothetical protein HYY60_01065 [Parcubacteria group bacterium]|nr:hypothetical protein [Parcubacteria group bacterium]MBI3075003.1 hypothetical protein [Parcubacteria group bacterium]